MLEAFYSDKLYPFMDRVLSLIRKAETTFYLTGGTVLGRHYLHHRYSDDLDLFVNQAPDFREQVTKTLEVLRARIPSRSAVSD
jgi:tRNA nucleotidyltransferase/poly(A) polymerase